MNFTYSKQAQLDELEAELKRINDVAAGAAQPTLEDVKSESLENGRLRVALVNAIKEHKDLANSEYQAQLIAEHEEEAIPHRAAAHPKFVKILSLLEEAQELATTIQPSHRFKPQTWLQLISGKNALEMEKRDLRLGIEYTAQFLKS